MALLIVISGPAGVGKTTICNRLLDEFKNSLSRVVTTTTRAPRIGETDGIDYFFISKNNFEENLQNGNFLEHGNGTMITLRAKTHKEVQLSLIKPDGWCQ